MPNNKPHPFNFMTTAGKSDVSEAVVQILVLKILYERGTAKGPSIIKELRCRTNSLTFIEEASGYIALSKLASSGWIRIEESTAIPRLGAYVLSPSAIRYLPQEMKEWQNLIDHWPQIIQHIERCDKNVNRDEAHLLADGLSFLSSACKFRTDVFRASILLKKVLDGCGKQGHYLEIRR